MEKHTSKRHDVEEKIVVIYNEDLSTVNDMLKNGWSVKDMSSCGYQWDNQGVSSCYICLIREIKEL